MYSPWKGGFWGEVRVYYSSLFFLSSKLDFRDKNAIFFFPLLENEKIEVDFTPFPCLGFLFVFFFVSFLDDVIVSDSFPSPPSKEKQQQMHLVFFSVKYG